MDSRDSAPEYGEAESLAGDSRRPRALVTGARGFLGRAVVRRLLAGGWAVDAVSSVPRSGSESDSGDVDWHLVDLLDSAATRRLVAGLEASHLIHLAWAPNRGVYHSKANARWAAAGAELFAAFVESGGRRAVGAGSSAEYDWSAGVCREFSTPLSGGSAYGEAKRALAEDFLELFGSKRQAEGDPQVSGAWARIFFLFGPGEPEGRLVSSVARSLLEGGPVRCSEGSQIRDYLYVEDAADALVRLLASDLSGPFNVASGEGVPVRELVLGLADRIGGAERIEWGDRDPNPSVVADTSRLQEELDWSPPIGLAEGLDRTVAWWRERIESES